MSKSNRLRKQVQIATPEASMVGIKLGDHQFRVFGGLDCAFGARLADYPRYETVPEEFRRGQTPANRVASTLFFKGGSLDDFGLHLKAGVHRAAFFATLRALLSSFEPKHEHKEAVCAWLISECTEATSNA